MAEKHKKGYVATLPVHFVPFVGDPGNVGLR